MYLRRAVTCEIYMRLQSWSRAIDMVRREIRNRIDNAQRFFTALSLVRKM